MKKKIIIISLVIVTFSIIFIYYIYHKNNKILDIDDIISDSKIDVVDYDIDFSMYEEVYIDLHDGENLIDEDGVYYISGHIDDGYLLVNTSNNVLLVLNGVDITNSVGPAIIINNAKNTVIELKEGTNNKLTDGYSYSNSEYDGCIYSKDDLIFRGSGNLEVNSNYLDGIVSNDSLVFLSGNYLINSIDDGIRGKDLVYIEDGVFEINAKGDGIKSTNDTDDSLGNVKILDGSFNISVSLDGIDAYNKLVIDGGSFKIETTYTSEDKSSKGLKATDNILINNGDFIINSIDDGIHSNNYLTIVNGRFEIETSDDGIHADKLITISNGNIDIKECYEGIEANDITINDEIISINSIDDGINISGGNDESGFSGRPGDRNMQVTAGELIINGGDIYISSSGDGIDANGNVTINDGKIIIEGPTENSNGAIDYDGYFNIHGGTFIATGSRDMAMGVSDTSSQYTIMYYLDNKCNDSKLSIIDNDNLVIADATLSKEYQTILVSSPLIKNNQEYTLIIDDKEIDSLTTSKIMSYNRDNFMPHNGRR